MLGLLGGGWAHFQFFSVANTQTWHKSSMLVAGRLTVMATRLLDVGFLVLSECYSTRQHSFESEPKTQQILAASGLEEDGID